jgi:predicted nucleotidyltransferase
VTRSEQGRLLGAALREAIVNVEVYVFGSWTRDRCARDVDLLIVYEETRSTDPEISNLRRRMQQEVWRVMRLPAHITALTVEEARETNFVTLERCITLARFSAESILPGRPMSGAKSGL